MHNLSNALRTAPNPATQQPLQDSGLRMQFLGFDERDQVLLNALADQLGPRHQQIVQSFYDHLQQHSGLLSTLDNAALQRMLRAHRSYFDTLLRGARDEQFIAGRARIGHVHHLIGLDASHYLDAYCIYLNQMSDAMQDCLPEAARSDTHKALLRAAFFDIGITVNTYMQKAFDAMRDSEQRYALAIAGSNDGIWDWQVADDCIFLSARWHAMLGLPAEDAWRNAAFWRERIHPDDAARVDHDIESHRCGQTAALRIEHRMRHESGHYFWVLLRGVAFRDTQHHVVRMAGSLTDISERKEIEEQLLRDAQHDPLTRLPNRAQLWSRLEFELHRVHTGQAPRAALIFLDLDRFKLVNDNLGHEFGDLLLQHVANRLQSSIRPQDLVARLGGDEFAILVHDVSRSGHIEQVAERILRELDRPITLLDQQLVVCASMGIVRINTEQHSPADVLRDADLAMYRAKDDGRAGYALFDQQLRETSARRLRLEQQLRHAIEQDQLDFHYQPIVAIDSGRVVAVEALMRWPQGGVPPDEFVSVLEDTGLIIDLGYRLLHRALLHLRSWRQLGEPTLRLSWNVSARQLRAPQFCLNIQDALSALQLPASALVLEITENEIVDATELILGTLQQLKQIGIRLVIDDFGTGYSSLSYLHRLPVSCLKVDRSFVSGLPGDHHAGVITDAIIALAHSLEMQVVAEGVETLQQRQWLHERQVLFAQGFHYSRPVPALALASLLNSALPTAGLSDDAQTSPPPRSG